MEGRQADLDEAVQLQEALLLQVFTNFRDILLEGHAELGASAAEPASGEEPDPSAIGLPICWVHPESTNLCLSAGM